MKMFKIALSAILLLSVLSCTNKNNEEAPNNLIPETEMINILSDVCKVEARFQRRLTLKSLNNEDLVAHNYTIIFEKHHVTMQQFKDSYAYYETEPQKMQELFDQVIIQLTEEESKLKESEGEQKNI